MNIYVSNLSRQVSESELQSAFEEFGSVSSCKIIVDRFSGESRGFGFVEMDNTNEAKAAIEQLNGVNLAGQELSVKVAEPRKEKPAYGNNGGGYNRSSNSNYGGGRDSRSGGGSNSNYGNNRRRY